jgi:glucosamine-6-phosphate deaminase
MRIIACKTSDEFKMKAAQLIFDEINHKQASICLPTGSTPIPVYEQLIQLLEKQSDYSQVKFFNLDEYLGLAQDHHQSYAHFLNHHFYNHLNITQDQLYLIDGANDPKKECHRYDQLIDEIGRFDVVVDGIGSNGHIAFNEPADYFIARTHVSDIAESTIEANRRFFNEHEHVPRQAITIGFADIFKAKKVILLANGEHKYPAIDRFLSDPLITTQFPLSLLKMHPDLTLVLDQDALGRHFDYFAN